ncbi:MAG: hypothetical protein H0V51_09545, partial [Chloroflexi bacterium]|nr:hypothetical protein [Chloroflexota bacterium]
MSLLAALLLGLAGATPISAHDSAAPSAEDNEKRREARQLTEELKKGAPSAAKSTAARRRLVEQAERRRDLVNDLARRDPKGALDAAFEPAERGALPDFVRSLVEEWVTLEGELQVVHVDDEDGRGEYDIRLINNGRERPLRFGRTLKNVKPGDEVRVEGIALAGEPTVVADQVSVTSAASGVGPTGAQRTAIILASAPGVGTHPYANKDNTASIFFPSSNPKSARSFFLESSYGQTTIVGKSGAEGTAADVYGPYTLASATCDFYTVRDQALKAADSNVNYGSYDRVVISWNHAACGGGGSGTVRTQNVGSYDGADQQLSVALIFNAGLGATALNGDVSGVALHEYGHNLGVWHANALECGSVGVGSGGCSSNEYGDPSDLMGNTAGYGHFNAVHKDILTWLGGGRSQAVSSEGSYPIGAYEAAGSGVRVLKIPRTRDASGAVNGHYYLEYRKPTSAWNAFLTGRPDYGSGVLVHTSGTTPFCTAYCPPDFSGGGGGGDSHLVDTQPGSSSGSADFNDAPLVNGESYTDPLAGVTLRVTATGTATATVQVSFSTPSLSVQSIVYP